jgi:hypothetical protein
VDHHRWELYHKTKKLSELGLESTTLISTIITGNPGGTSIIIHKQSQASRNAAALINEHTHVATDSAGALRQIKK